MNFPLNERFFKKSEVTVFFVSVTLIASNYYISVNEVQSYTSQSTNLYDSYSTTRCIEKIAIHILELV